jgi:hypothetical protein
MEPREAVGPMEAMGVTSRERLRAAERVTAELDGALRELGVVLPSLRVDPVSCASTVIGPLVELGRCNLGTARRLVDVLGSAAGGGDRAPEGRA